jgi:rsbT co-antagonist protein RsbR
MRSPQARFFDLSLDLLATANADGYFVDLNAPWSAALGYTLDELRQKPFVEFVHPSDREATMREAAKLLAGGITVHFENRYQTKSGDWRWLAWTARHSQEDALIFACARDITPCKQLLTEKEQALSERERFRLLAENTTDFVGISTLDGRATYLNPAGKRLLGDPNLKIEKLRVSDCHPPRYSARIMKEGVPRAAKLGVWTSDGELRKRDGSTIPVSQVVVPLRNANGKLEGYGTIIRDLSVIGHLKKLEQDLCAQQQTLTAVLSETSTPIIPITDQVAVIPLLGTLDGRRAPQLLDSMMRAAETLRARVLILDATELRRLESSAAAVLIRTAAVLGLLGIEVVLTGFRGAVGQALFALGIKLSNSTQLDTLQSAIAYALHTTGASFGPTS